MSLREPHDAGARRRCVSIGALRDRQLPGTRRRRQRFRHFSAHTTRSLPRLTHAVGAGQAQLGAKRSLPHFTTQGMRKKFSRFHIRQVRQDHRPTLLDAWEECVEWGECIAFAGISPDCRIAQLAPPCQCVAGYGSRISCSRGARVTERCWNCLTEAGWAGGPCGTRARHSEVSGRRRSGRLRPSSTSEGFRPTSDTPKGAVRPARAKRSMWPLGC